jgi:hypothetical protein
MGKLMKKATCVLILIFISLSLFPDTLYFRSDWVGIELEKIDRYRIDEFDYVLEVTKETGKLVKKLYQKRKEWKRWEIISNTKGEKTDEFQYENNVLTLHDAFDKKARVKTEEIYKAGVLSEKKVYSYSTRGIDFADTFDSKENRLYTDEYVLAANGRLRSIRRVFPDNSVAVIHYTYGEGTLVGEWEYRDGKIFDTKFNERGKAIRREEWNRDQLGIVKEYAYDKDSGKIVSETETNLKEKSKIERTYDTDGNVALEKIESAAEEPFEISYTYDGKHKIAARKKSSIGIEEWKYTYNPDETIATEDYYKRGFLEMHTVYSGKDTRYEEILRDEEVFIRVYYVKDKKAKEEFIQDGKVIRTKEYP